MGKKTEFDVYKTKNEEEPSAGTNIRPFRLQKYQVSIFNEII
ncbi:MAG: hypothetical protein RRY10_04200 [Christensenellaceae bacterium]